MTAIIILGLFTTGCIIGALRNRDSSSKKAYIISAILFLLLICTHLLFNPSI